MLIKYIKSVLWRVAKCLSYIEEARCLKVKDEFGAVSFKLFGCELPEDGYQPKHVAARKGEIYISKISAFVGTKRL